LVEKAYKRSIEIVTENKDKIETLANKLLEKEVIFREDLIEIFGKRPYEDQRKKFEQDAEEEVKKLRANGNNNLEEKVEDKLIAENSTSENVKPESELPEKSEENTEQKQ
jgi:cell division protease FtsH